MTKLYISADLEGVCGVVSPNQCSREPDQAAYERACEQMALEVETVIEEALAQGVTEILVNDSHCSMINLGYDVMHPQVSLLSGKPKRCAMSAGLDETFDAAMLIGYHAKAGTHLGVLSHTFHHKVFDVSINGQSYGEGGINALHASLKFGVPLVMASGDAAFCTEIQSLVPGIGTVETKQGLGQTAAVNHPWEQVEADYVEKTRQSLGNQKAWKKQILKLKAPYELRVTFINSLAADAANLIPGLTRLDGRTLSYTSDSFETVYQMLQSAYTIQAAPTDFLQ